MLSSRQEPIPVTNREIRLFYKGKKLRAELIRAIRVATGRGPRGRDNVVCEIRNRLAPELWGVVSENVLFRDRRWIFVTAPGEMFYGPRKLDLIRVCSAANSLERAVLVLEPDTVRELSSLYADEMTGPAYAGLPERLKAALLPLYVNNV